MAGRQDAAGGGGPRDELTGGPIAVLVHDRLEAEAALGLGAAGGHAVELVVPVGMVGPAFAAALEQLLEQPVTAWCDDLPGLALESLRVGLGSLILEARTAIEVAAAERLADIAEQQGATLATSLPSPLFRLSANRRRLLPVGLGEGPSSVP